MNVRGLLLSCLSETVASVAGSTTARGSRVRRIIAQHTRKVPPAVSLEARHRLSDTLPVPGLKLCPVSTLLLNTTRDNFLFRKNDATGAASPGAGSKASFLHQERLRNGDIYGERNHRRWQQRDGVRGCRSFPCKRREGAAVLTKSGKARARQVSSGAGSSCWRS